ncbi:MAG TPA: hypothetical protein VGP16_04690, partial [Asanoa sp.]|nr:hypothetical protein [Asanoa sp.]
YIATTVGSNATSGIRTALWIALGLSGGGTLLAVSLYVLGGVRPPTPSLERWFGGGSGWYSPPLFAAVRRGSVAEEPSPD